MADFIPPIIARIVGDNLGLKATLADSEAGIASFGNKASGLGAVMGKVGGATIAAAAGIGIAAVKMAGDFQANMTKLVTSAGEAPSALKKVSDGVLNMAVQTGTSTKELSNGLYMIESAGFHSAAGLEVLRAAAQGARAEQAPLADVANAVTSALKSYGLQASDAVTVTNQMVATVGHGKMTMQDLAGSLATVLPIAANAGITFNQLGGAIATLTGHGTSAQEATQELANTIRNLQAPNNVAINEMQQLGISSNDISENLGKRGLTGTLELLSETVLRQMGPSGEVLLNSFNQSKAAANDANIMISKMPASLQALAKEYQQGKISLTDWTKSVKALPADQANLAKQFAVTQNKASGFNQQLKLGTPASQTYEAAIKAMTGGATGLNTTLMLTGGNMATFKSNVDAVANAAHNSGKNVNGWNEIQKTFNFQLSQFKEQAEKTGIQLGTKLIPPLMEAMKWVQNNTGTVKDLAQAIGVFLAASVTVFVGQKAVSLVKSFIGVGKAGVDAVKGIAAFAKGVGGATNAVVENGEVIKKATAANQAGQLFNSIGKGAKAAAVQVGTLTKSLVLQGAAAIKTAAAWVAQKVAVVASAIAEKAAAVAQWLLNIAMDANPIGLIILAIAALIAIVILVVTHWKQVSKFFEGLWKDIKAIFWDAVHAIGGAISAAIKWVEGLPKKAGAAFGKFIAFVKALPGNVLKGVEEIPKIFDAGLKKVGYAIGYAAGWIVRQAILIPYKLGQIFRRLWDDGLHIFEQGATKIIAWSVALPGRLLKWVTDTWHRGVAIAKQLWSDLLNWFEQGGAKVLAWTNALPGKIIKFAVDTYNSVNQWANKMWSDLVNWFMQGGAKVLAWTNSLPGKIAKFFSDMWHDATSWVSRIWHDVVSYFESLPGNAMKGLNALPGMIGKIWSNLVNDAVGFGKNIINGLLNGLKAMASTVTKWISDFASSIGGGFMKALGIGSPSKLFHQFGTYIGMGLVNGLQSMTGAVASQAKVMAAAAVSGFGSPTLQVAAAGASGPVGLGTQSGTLAVNTSALAVGASGSATGADSGPVTLYFQMDSKTVAKAVYPSLAALVQQHKNRNSARSGTMLS